MNVLENKSDISSIPLTKGLNAIIDKCDYERISQYPWHAKRYGKHWYAARKLEGRTHFMHWDILGRRDGFITDHINGNGLDNRQENLRYATKSTNAGNMKKRQDKKYKGVCYHKHRKKWFAQICVNGKIKHLGFFGTEMEAARAYDRAAIEHFGEFANINLDYPEDSDVKK
jgi:hypothetical protein